MAFNTAFDTSRMFPANAMAAPMVPLQQSLPPRLCYFISRSNGTCVPLIPADELPYSVRLQDVPRVMSIGDTCGMQHVGVLPVTGQYFRPEKNSMPRPVSEMAAFDSSHTRSQSAVNMRQVLAPDAMIRAGLVSQTTTSPMPTSHPTSTARPISAAVAASSWRRSETEPVDSTQAAIDAIIASNAEAVARATPTSRTSTPPSGSTPDQERKVYCTHWIRHGECDYTQQGCLYKHEMPARDILEKIGFRTVPRWYLEKTAPRLEGMSSLPTVGAPMKATEWLERKLSSSSDADDESEASGSEDESGNDGKGARDDSAPTAVRNAVRKDMDTIVAEAETSPSPPSTPRLFDNIRKLSVDDDLIDFAPLLPTPSSSECATLAVAPAESTTSMVCQSSGTSSKEGSPPSTPCGTQKVFVPAGESPEYHIAQARDRARSAEKMIQNQLDAGYQSKDVSNGNSTGRQVTTQSPPSPKQVQILQRPVISGLMASKHAPRAIVSSSKPELTTPAPTIRPTLAKRAASVAPAAAIKTSATDTRDRKTHANRDPVCRLRRPAGSAPRKAKEGVKMTGTARKQGVKTAQAGE